MFCFFPIFFYNLKKIKHLDWLVFPFFILFLFFWNFVKFRKTITIVWKMKEWFRIKNPFVNYLWLQGVKRQRLIHVFLNFHVRTPKCENSTTAHWLCVFTYSPACLTSADFQPRSQTSHADITETGKRTQMGQETGRDILTLLNIRTTFI